MPDRLDLARLIRHIVADPTGPVQQAGAQRPHSGSRDPGLGHPSIAISWSRSSF